MRVERFEIPMYGESDRDLKNRLSNTRPPRSFESMEWHYGMNPRWAQSLLDDWLTFDWQEARDVLNRFDHRMYNGVDGRLHFVHFGGNKGLPILLLHGWPSSFIELLDVAERLNEAGHQVVVPSLPGFIFSTDIGRRGLHASYAADALHQLMTHGLNHDRYLVHGGDFGANIGNRLGVFYPDNVVAIHVLAALHEAIPRGVTDAEVAFTELVDRWYETHGAYMHVNRTQAQTLAYGLSDSPAGLGIWIAEKYWSWCEFDQSLEEVIDRKSLLTLLTLYWHTNSLSSGNRWYADSQRLDNRVDGNTRVRIPARLFLTTESVDRCPRSLIEGIYDELNYGLADKGGHFLAWEQPNVLAADLLAFASQYS